jgi:hypothetical protein
MPVDDARVVAAREAYAVVFPHGTTFLSGTAADLEVEGGRALDRAREPATRASLASLGFAPVVKQARKELGRLCAAGVATAAVPEEVATRANGLTALQEASAALREYARIVQAVDVVDCTSERHALLAPFVHHRVTKAKRAQAPEPPVVRAANDADADEAPPSRAA